MPGSLPLLGVAQGEGMRYPAVSQAPSSSSCRSSPAVPPSVPGLYVLEGTARVNNGSVTLGGKTYKDVRHTATLRFEIKP